MKSPLTNLALTAHDSGMVTPMYTRSRLFVVVPLLITAWLYLPAVRLPFFSDDVLHFYYAANTSPIDIWTRPDVTQLYYRPLINYLLHLALVPLHGLLSAPYWHFVVVANHLINVALVGALARILRLGHSGQIVAMTLFGVFPFSVQAVVWILAWFHPFVTFCLLVAVIAGVRWMKSGRRHWWIAACAAGLAAPFTHENGLLTAALFVMVAGMVFGMRGLLVRWRRGLAVLLPLTGFILLYFGIRTRVSPPSWSLPDLGEFLLPNLAIFAQGISYPMQAITARLAAAPLVEAGIGVLLLAILCLSWWVRGGVAVRAALTGLLWWAGASLPAAVGLPSGYLTLSERLLYVVAPGVALFFGGLAQVVHPVRRGIAAGVIVVIVMGSGLLIRDYQHLYAVMGSGYRAIIEATKDDQKAVLLVNAPLQIDSERYVFPYTRVHAFMLHEYVNLDHFFWLNTGQMTERFFGVEFPPAASTWPGYATHFFGSVVSEGDLHAQIRAAERVVLFILAGTPSDPSAKQVNAHVVGDRANSAIRANSRTAFVVDFDHTVRLEAVTFERVDEHTLRAGLWWVKLNDTPLPHIAFVHLICGDQIVDQVDAAPLGGLYGFAAWSPDESWIDYRDLHTSTPLEDEADTCLHLRVGLYERETGIRAAVSDVQGHAMPVEWVTLPVRLMPTP